MKCASNDWLHVHLSNKQQEYKLKISHRIYVHVIYDTRDINMPVREQENDGGTGQVAGQIKVGRFGHIQQHACSHKAFALSHRAVWSRRATRTS